MDDEDQGDEPISLSARRIARDHPDDVTEFRPVLSFEDRRAECPAAGCRDFVFGYEAGQLAARLDAKPERWEGTYHAQNLDMLIRVAESKGYEAAPRRSGDPTWLFVVFTPKPPEARLKLIKPPEKQP
jgi:hypothetical protein